jgi:hypothetical protein
MGTFKLPHNQKEQRLNKILSAHGLHVKRKNLNQASQLREFYGRVQQLGYGESLSVRDSVRVKKLIANARQ